MTRRQLFLLCGLLALAGTTLAQNNKVLRLATTTSVKNSGLTDYLLPRFTADTGFQVKLFSVGSGAALRLGRLGEVDTLLVHAPKAEQRFIDEGYGVERLPVMHNDFIIVGPTHELAGIGGMLDVSSAFKKVASSGGTFLSRGDDSGTHKQEMSIWRAIGIDPFGKDWYLETGTSMGKALKIASEKQAYTISDRATWLANKDKLKLSLLLQGDKLLHNSYHVIGINPTKHRGINHKATKSFIDWIRSPRVQNLIGDYRVEGEPLFVPDAHNR